jgi:hypothetical protein
LTFCKAGFRTPKSLQIRRAGHRPRICFAGSLELEDWYDFGKALQKKGIAVNNKLWGIYGDPSSGPTADSQSTDSDPYTSDRTAG